MTVENQDCSIELAFSDEGEGGLDEWVPLEAQVLPPPGPSYQPNRFCLWAIYGDAEAPLRRGVIYTKHCSRKLSRSWAREAEAGRLEVIYLVESPQAIRRSPWIRYVVATIYPDLDDRLPIKFARSEAIKMWRRGSVEHALEQGGVILNPNGTAFDSLEEYDQYMERYNQMKASARKHASG